MDRSPDHRDTKHELELRTSRNEKEEEEEERKKTRWHTCGARSANAVRSKFENPKIRKLMSLYQ